MALSEHQKTVVDIALKNDRIVTHSKVCEKISYYNNTSKYVSEILSRMVKQGLLIRIKKGVFELSNRTKKSNVTINENQNKLF